MVFRYFGGVRFLSLFINDPEYKVPCSYPAILLNALAMRFHDIFHARCTHRRLILAHMHMYDQELRLTLYQHLSTIMKARGIPEELLHYRVNCMVQTCASEACPATDTFSGSLLCAVHHEEQ